jgi:hypothetical protein
MQTSEYWRYVESTAIFELTAVHDQGQFFYLQLMLSGHVDTAVAVALAGELGLNLSADDLVGRHG